MNNKFDRYLNKKIKNLNLKEIKTLWEIIKIKKELSNIMQYYPNNINHFFNKVLVWINFYWDKIISITKKNTNEEIWFIILKNHWNEKKIRTIYIKEKFRNKGYWVLFMKIAINLLWKKYPHYTVPEELWWIYSKIVKKFWHNVSNVIEWLYRKWKKEYIINWKLKEKEWY